MSIFRKLTLWWFILELLCPLKNPAELADHPSLSYAYTSQALEKLVEAVKNKLHQERTLLWRAKNLHSQFLGDCTWMPCGAVESPDDDFLFEPRRAANSYTQSAPSFDTGTAKHSTNDKITTGDPSEKSYVPPAEDVEMADAPAPEEAAEDTHGDKTQGPEVEDGISGASSILPKDRRSTSVPPADVNATRLEASSRKQSVQSAPEIGEQPSKPDDESKDGAAEANTDQTEDSKDAEDKDKNEDKTDTGSGERRSADVSSPEPPRRMTTRAQTNQATTSNQPNTQDSSRAPSPSYTADSSSTTSNLAPHPLFTLQSYTRPDRNFGLPANEADETRRLLWSYVQKQEETVRSFSRLLDSLMKAYRMKEEVWEWCKAEGHVGEMSDGEDWYDKEKWGLGEGEELKKGIHEPDDDGPEDGRVAGKRGRGRRQ